MPFNYYQIILKIQLQVRLIGLKSYIDRLNTPKVVRLYCIKLEH